jgi:hypothetical protein
MTGVIYILFTYMYYAKRSYKLINYEKSNTKHKKYDAILKNKITQKKIRVPFGDNRYENYHDKTGLGLYDLHGDNKRRARYRKRHKKDLKSGYYSPGWFSYYILW